LTSEAVALRTDNQMCVFALTGFWHSIGLVCCEALWVNGRVDPVNVALDWKERVG